MGHVSCSLSKAVVIYSVLGWLQCTKLPAHWTLHTKQYKHCTMHTLNCTVHTRHCKLRTTHWTVHTAHCTVHTAHCIVQTAHWTVHTEQYILHGLQCKLHNKQYTLHSPHNIMYSSLIGLDQGKMPQQTEQFAPWLIYDTYEKVGPLCQQTLSFCRYFQRRTRLPSHNIQKVFCILLLSSYIFFILENNTKLINSNNYLCTIVKAMSTYCFKKQFLLQFFGP